MLGNAGGLGAKSSRFATVIGKDAVQPRDVPQQRSKGWCGCGNQAGDGSWSSARLDERLAQVDQMTLDLRLAGAAQIGRRDGDIDERVVPEDDLMRANNFPVLKRERVERPSELGLGKDERRGDMRSSPARRQRCARVQVIRREAVYERQTRERRGIVAFNMRSIRGHRTKSIAEHAAKIAGE